MSAKNPRVLIVDDIADNLFLLKAFLESEGFIVDMADSGTAALERMQTLSPQLVLLDVMMPDMNGYQLTQAIRRNSQLSALPVVLITAHIEACRIKGLAAGATDFVRKPINFEELLTKIQGLLTYRGSRN